MAEQKKLTHCNFCGKSNREIKKMIAGPSVAICDECTILCVDILIEENFFEKDGVTRQMQLLRREKRLADMAERMDSLIAAHRAQGLAFALLEQDWSTFKLLNVPVAPKDSDCE